MKFAFLAVLFLVSGSPLTIQAQQPANNNRPYALVAGGSKGIGYAISKALAKRGFNLVLIARHEDGLILAKQKLESENPQ